MCFVKFEKEKQFDDRIKREAPHISGKKFHVFVHMKKVHMHVFWSWGDSVTQICFKWSFLYNVRISNISALEVTQDFRCFFRENICLPSLLFLLHSSIQFVQTCGIVCGDASKLRNTFSRLLSFPEKHSDRRPTKGKDEDWIFFSPVILCFFIESEFFNCAEKWDGRF